MKDNIVKSVCRELDITQKALARTLAVSEGTINRWSSKPDTIPQQALKMLELLQENKRLKDQQSKIVTMFTLMEEIKENSKENAYG